MDRLLLLVGVAGKALRVNVLRSVLTMLGIIIGVGSVIVMVALGAGAQAKVDTFIESLGGNILMLGGGFGRPGAGVRLAAGSVQTLSEQHADLIEKQVPGVDAVAPVLFGQAQVVVGNLNWSTEVMGIDNRFLRVRNWPIDSGREFSMREASSAAKVAIVGATIVKELFGESDPVGSSIRINNFNAEIIGVLEPKGQDARGDDQDDIVLLPIQTVRNRITGISLHNPKAIQVAQIRVQDGQDLMAVEEDIRVLMRQEFRVNPNDDDPFFLRNLTEMIQTRAETTRIFNSLLTAVASVSLVVGGIGIMNIMLVSVTERTREIGLRMAVGATPGDILTQFLVEAVVLCGLGGLIGIVIAFGVVQLIGRLSEAPGVIYPQVVLLSLAFSALIGVFFGYYPAWKASKLQPIDALRHE
jgi:putative ABC transport system permease protein